MRRSRPCIASRQTPTLAAGLASRQVLRIDEWIASKLRHAAALVTCTEAWGRTGIEYSMSAFSCHLSHVGRVSCGTLAGIILGHSYTSIVDRLALVAASRRSSFASVTTDFTLRLLHIAVSIRLILQFRRDASNGLVPQLHLHMRTLWYTLSTVC